MCGCLHGVHALAPAQEAFERFDGRGLAAYGASLALDNASAAQQGRDLLGDLVLHREHVARIALELFRTTGESPWPRR
jgi:hypothetical protein